MQSLLNHHGYLALVLLAIIEATCIPIPSEITFGFAGVLAATGHLSLAGVIVLGTLGELVGSSIAYGVGRLGGRPLVERLGRYVLLTRADLDRAEAFFDGRGEFAVAIGRALPLIRAFVSLVAGISEMAPLRFFAFNAIGTLAYAAALSGLGYAVGNSWHTIAHDFSLAGYVVLGLVVIAIAAVLAHRIRTLRSERAALQGEAVRD
jgi:membrane protein DedA with SNARE-associated domain